MVNSSLSLAVVLVRQLAPPVSEEYVYSNRPEYGCLFDKDDDCVRIDHEKIARFVRSPKIYARIYSSVLYDRFFDNESEGALRNAYCLRPNVLILVATDGLINDPRLYPLVHVHSGIGRLDALCGAHYGPRRRYCGRIVFHPRRCRFRGEMRVHSTYIIRKQINTKCKIITLLQNKPFRVSCSFTRRPRARRCEDNARESTAQCVQRI